MPKKSKIAVVPQGKLAVTNRDNQPQIVENANRSEIVLYRPNDSTTLEVRFENETVWLTQQQIAELFGVRQPAISKHISNIYASGELDEGSTYSILEYMGNEGKQRYQTKLYSLDLILAVGYRVNSREATGFRRWATDVLRNYLLRGYAINQQLMHVEERMDKRFHEQEKRLEEVEQKVNFFVRTSLPPVEGIFFDGQIFDAYTFASDLVREAKKRIILIDNYVDDSVLTLLDKREKGVSATIFTQSITPQLRLDLKKHNAQYAPIDVQQFTRSHDRFLCIDDTVYHLGASLKDLGKKWFAFSRMVITTDALLSNMK